MDKCTRSASEFLRCASVLSEAREAYDRLRTLRGEIQKVLSSDEEKLSSLMEQVHKTADTQLPNGSPQSISERKTPESSKIATISVANGERSKMNRFP